MTASADLSESVLFPILKTHRGGIEGLRLVRFQDDRPQPACVYGTYTAFPGTGIRSELFETRDSRRVTMTPLRRGTGQGYDALPPPRRRRLAG